jgi:hypothetical protein
MVENNEERNFDFIRRSKSDYASALIFYFGMKLKGDRNSIKLVAIEKQNLNTTQHLQAGIVEHLQKRISHRASLLMGSAVTDR